MKLTNYTEDKVLEETIRNSLDSIDPTNTEYLVNFIKSISMEGYSHGVIDATAAIKEKKGTLQKSKELTNFLPSHFIKNETGQRLTNTVLESVASLANEDNELIIGYEVSLAQNVANIIRIAYSIGVSVGFEIASDKLSTEMYKHNERRFMTSEK